ncbi:hypothetical protein FZ029_21245 [Azospirillum sp. Sh1]|nr:hypothetical protein FZ029_21245 [Azospirillum sp. Sh1]
MAGTSVIPAKAGIQSSQGDSDGKAWIPAFAGMTGFLGRNTIFICDCPPFRGVSRHDKDPGRRAGRRRRS